MSVETDASGNAAAAFREDAINEILDTLHAYSRAVDGLRQFAGEAEMQALRDAERRTSVVLFGGDAVDGTTLSATLRDAVLRAASSLST